mmetsp:Transcript_392/g.719  ORF Transcript_392/g.719 Transcript_392/m.719 type:complete len:88 (-) Transcript_392:646-909(-)|eukprot:CAMPEP_0206402662 /NCGR_PEP_ID=MMETSP0294-20121207/27144_1 /ASSEMBLY_ACC=CAM_ASM_000327 /TAXON_ID=39354 /ORGANISM="Heterosigma akashiwo, Strain CCMP2393" /LENGTH=87 /DNA_ID=CAMNT_0053859887 /DNA_START=50 /DNA_END=313 /DNA_ORIENTATION=-
MALSTRHRWCLSKIIESFSPELEEEDAHRFMREEAHQKFTQFFRGEASNKLFVYFQPAAGHEVALVSSILALLGTIFTDGKIPPDKL